MTDTIITVQGEHSAWYPAERATVSASVHGSGGQRDEVLQRVTATAARIRDSLDGLTDRDAGPVTRWSSERVRVWTDRPWAADGQPGDPVVHAAIDVGATFRDFEALAGWVETTAELPDAAITGIAWELTESTRTSAVAEVRSRAVKDAVAKATVFAQSIGLRQVRAIALADPGMLGDQTGGGAPTPMVRASMLASDAAPQLTLKPEQLAVTAVVDARFVAS